MVASMENKEEEEGGEVDRFVVVTESMGMEYQLYSKR